MRISRVQLCAKFQKRMFHRCLLNTRVWQVTLRKKEYDSRRKCYRDFHDCASNEHRAGAITPSIVAADFVTAFAIHRLSDIAIFFRNRFQFPYLSCATSGMSLPWIREEDRGGSRRIEDLFLVRDSTKRDRDAREVTKGREKDECAGCTWRRCGVKTSSSFSATYALGAKRKYWDKREYAPQSVPSTLNYYRRY